jgi:hypothetical protein
MERWRQIVVPACDRTPNWNEMWKADRTGSENLRKLDMAAYEWFGLLQTERLLGRVVSSANRKLKQQYARSSFRKATAAFAASHSINRLGGCRRVFFWIRAQGTIKTDEMTSGSFKSHDPRGPRVSLEALLSRQSLFRRTSRIQTSARQSLPRKASAGSASCGPCIWDSEAA